MEATFFHRSPNNPILKKPIILPFHPLKRALEARADSWKGKIYGHWCPILHLTAVLLIRFSRTSSYTTSSSSFTPPPPFLPLPDEVTKRTHAGRNEPYPIQFELESSSNRQINFIIIFVKCHRTHSESLARSAPESSNFRTPFYILMQTTTSVPLSKLHCIPPSGADFSFLRQHPSLLSSLLFWSQQSVVGKRWKSLKST